LFDQSVKRRDAILRFATAEDSGVVHVDHFFIGGDDELVVFQCIALALAA